MSIFMYAIQSNLRGLCTGKAYCAAAIRLGIGYMEVPFFATHAEKRHRGYGRALLEVGLPKTLSPP